MWRRDDRRVAFNERPPALSAETYGSATVGASYWGGAGAAQVDQGADDEDPNEEHKPGKPEGWGGHDDPNHDGHPAQPVR